jgi:hypothetical protein
MQHWHVIMQHFNVINATWSAFMQQCLMLMHDDTYDHILVAFNIWDVT